MDRNTGVINSTQDIDVVDIVSFMVELVSNPVHVDEMVEEKSHSFSSWHRSTIQRTWKEFTSLQLFYIGKTNGCFDTAFHQTIPVIAHKYAILINF
jgi:acetate kinase